jgi:hypothetical protein
VTIGLEVYLLLYCAWYVTRRTHTADTLRLSETLFLIMQLMPSIFAFRAAFTRRLDRRTRRAWLILACTLAVYTFGFTYALVTEIQTGAPFPFPSWVDVVFLSMYPCLLWGLLTFPFRQQSPAERTAFWLDVAVVMTGMGTFIWYVILGPLAAAGFLNMFEMLLTLGYLMGDMALVFGITVVLLRQSPASSRGALLLLVAALAILSVSDVFFAYLRIHDTFEFANAVYPLWACGAFFEALSG